jgi:hypothetical protein
VEREVTCVAQIRKRAQELALDAEPEPPQFAHAIELVDTVSESTWARLQSQGEWLQRNEKQAKLQIWTNQMTPVGSQAAPAHIFWPPSGGAVFRPMTW